MINSTEWCNLLKENDFNFSSGVPCSSLASLQSYVIDSPEFQYVTATNEGQAVATAVGARISGNNSFVLMQNSGIGNAVNPITSLVKVFEVPILIICSWRGQPGVKDEPQHQIMGRITHQQFDLMEIPNITLSENQSEANKQLEVALHYIKKERKSYAIIVPDGCFIREPNVTQVFASQPLGQFKDHSGNRTTLPKRYSALEICLKKRQDDGVIIATTGKTGRELYTAGDFEHNFYTVGSMGLSSSIALGIALSCQNTVMVIDGDGAALMHLGALATIGAYKPNNLIHIILDNHCYDSTGAQSSVSINVPFAQIAVACGYSYGYKIDCIEIFEELLEKHNQKEGAILIHMEISSGSISPLKRPNITPSDVASRLQKFICHN